MEISSLGKIGILPDKSEHIKIIRKIMRFCYSCVGNYYLCVTYSPSSIIKNEIISNMYKITREEKE